MTSLVTDTICFVQNNPCYSSLPLQSTLHPATSAPRRTPPCSTATVLPRAPAPACRRSILPTTAAGSHLESRTTTRAAATGQGRSRRGHRVIRTTETPPTRWPPVARHRRSRGPPPRPDPATTPPAPTPRRPSATRSIAEWLRRSSPTDRSWPRSANSAGRSATRRVSLRRCEGDRGVLRRRPLRVTP